MKCPKCHSDNEIGAKFCNECGVKLEIACPECGKTNRPGSKFCNECGHNLTLPLEPAPKDLSFDEKLEKIQRYLPKGLTEKILSQRDRIEGERKQVTVMFCDMEGFTPLTERLGPDEAYSIMDQVYEILIHKVHQYEGTVNEMTGDGIMGLFGAPIALEDAPQRAIRSAMAIHREMTKFSERIRKEKEGIRPPKMRIGIHTGPVVVGTLGNDLRVEFKAVGDTVNLAARMEGLAEPGTTYVSEEVFKLTEGFFRFEALGEKEAKGKKEPLRIYRVLAHSTRRTRFDVSAERGLTPFIGREREVELLYDGLERSKAGRGQAFSIVSEAGVGKSRLLYEFRKILTSEDVTFLEGKCLSYSRGVAYHPIIDILKSNFDLHDEDSDSEIWEKVKRGLQILRADEASTLPYLLELLSVKDSGIDEIPLSPEAKKYRIMEALKHIVIKGSEIRPLILAYEDLHWMDKSSEDVLRYLLESISGARVFMIFTYRPEFVHTWGGRSYHSQVNLNRLSNRESLSMVAYLLGTEHIESGLEDFVLEKTEGIPFFIEEFIKSLKDLQVIERKNNTYRIAKDIQTVTIPSTIQDVIMARVDSLPEGTKAALQTGSVVGREFSHELIKRVTGLPEQELLSHLSLLRESELLYERGIYPQSVYIIKHALTHEVAHHSLLMQRRKELHRVIGLAVEELYADRLAEQYEVLAHHFSKGEEWGKALDYLIRAAQKATKGFATREAVVLYDQALEATGHLGKAVETEALMAIHRAKSELYAILSDFERARAEGECLLALARRIGDRVNEGSALVKMASASYWAHDFDRALEYSRDAIKVAEEADAQQVLASAHFTAGTVHAITGRLDQAEKEFDWSLRLSQSMGDVVYESQSLIFAGYLKNWEGQFAEALRLQSEALRIAREHSLAIPLLRGLFGHGLILTGKGDYDEGLEALEEGAALSERLGDEFYGYRFLNSLGWLYGEIGDLDRAIDLNRRGAEGSRKRGDPEGIANAEINLGDIFLMKKDLTMAQKFLDGIYRLVKDPSTTDWMKWRYSTHLFASLGELWLARGDLSRGRDFADRCLELATRTNSRKYLVKGGRLRGEIAFVGGQKEEAEDALRQALIIAQAIGNPTQLWKTYAVLGDLLQAQRRPDDARQAYSDAVSVIEEVASGLKDKSLRDTFMSSHHVQEIRHKAQSENVRT
jgi:class 3 adenylate cyclase/tetratricopeptide (TPR) repeat protein